MKEWLDDAQRRELRKIKREPFLRIGLDFLRRLDTAVAKLERRNKRKRKKTRAKT